jgi:hypothetical protein
MGFKTAKGKPVTPQTFEKMLKNPFYAGWVVSGETKVRGNHDALITQEQFNEVQQRLAGKSNGKITHKKINEDFPSSRVRQVRRMWEEYDCGVEPWERETAVRLLLLLE